MLFYYNVTFKFFNTLNINFFHYLIKLKLFSRLLIIYITFRPGCPGLPSMPGSPLKPTRISNELEIHKKIYYYNIINF
jgi:hypothetical protein